MSASARPDPPVGILPVLILEHGGQCSKGKKVFPGNKSQVGKGERLPILVQAIRG